MAADHQPGARLPPWFGTRVRQTRVLESAIPEVVAAVEKGSMSVSSAALLSLKSEDAQREEATNPHRNRTYQSITKPPKGNDDDIDEEKVPEVIKSKGVGIIHANEAINCLQRIPSKDPLRGRGFQLVADWIKTNK